MRAVRGPETVGHVRSGARNGRPGSASQRRQIAAHLTSIIGFLRRVIRALAGPFLLPRRFEQVTRSFGQRFDRLERDALGSVALQQQLARRITYLALEQEKVRRLVSHEAVSEGEAERQLFGRPLPLEVQAAPEADAVAGGGDTSDCPKRDILVLHECPACGASERTIVCRFNKMITMRRMPDGDAARYDYAMCHRCGVVYATRRPAGPRFAWLLEHFEESLGRTEMGTQRDGKLTLSSTALDDEGRARLRRLAAPGVFVSEHRGLKNQEYLPQLAADRLSNSRHVELLGSLLELRAPRVLEIRSRMGSILAGLQRLYGAEVFAIPMFTNQQFLIQEVYGIPAASCLDFDQFTIPYEPPFDLVIANHMLTHIVRPKQFLDTLRSSMRRGGHLYLYNEPLEEEFLHHEKSLFNTLNAFHMQTFDPPSLTRVLNANGFEVIYFARERMNIVCLARKAEDPIDWAPMTDSQRSRRRTAYRVAHDLSVLLLLEHARHRFARDWPATLERAQRAGTVAPDAKGRLRIMRRILKAEA